MRHRRRCTSRPPCARWPTESLSRTPPLLPPWLATATRFCLDAIDPHLRAASRHRADVHPALPRCGRRPRPEVDELLRRTVTAYLPADGSMAVTVGSRTSSSARSTSHRCRIERCCPRMPSPPISSAGAAPWDDGGWRVDFAVVADGRAGVAWLRHRARRCRRAPAPLRRTCRQHSDGLVVTAQVGVDVCGEHKPAMWPFSGRRNVKRAQGDGSSWDRRCQVGGR